MLHQFPSIFFCCFIGDPEVCQQSKGSLRVKQYMAKYLIWNVIFFLLSSTCVIIWTSFIDIVCHPDRTPGTCFTDGREERVPRSRRRRKRVRVQRKKKDLKEDHTELGEMERSTTRCVPYPGLQRGWTREETTTRRSHLTAGTRGRDGGRLGVGRRGENHGGAEEAETRCSPRCIFCPGRSRAGRPPPPSPGCRRDNELPAEL